MAGHSKWANIKRKKGVNDAKRGALFTKLIREVTVAAREGGEDIDSNSRLRTAVAKARAANMPADNIERAIKKGAGNLEGVIYDEVRYEGYGPGGVAIMVDCLTDNKNRTTPEIRKILNKNGGNLGDTGSVSYLFEKKGIIALESSDSISEDDVLEILLEYDVEDVKSDEGNIIVTVSPEAYSTVSEFLMKENYNIIMNELSYIPVTNVPLDEEKGALCLKIIELLEEHDDVQEVYSNYDIADEIMAKLSGEG